ncbi:RNA-binding domain-containing protein [Penicillium tannophilum]|nr:RNA-binding domain-containing protein [Penicillium tannophilum]
MTDDQEAEPGAEPAQDQFLVPPSKAADVTGAAATAARVRLAEIEAHPGAQRQIVVEKLTKNVTEPHLREIFGEFGDIEKLELPMNPAFMTNRGTAYILYYDPADAEAAIAHMHEAQLDGTNLNVSIVLPRRNFSRYKKIENNEKPNSTEIHHPPPFLYR